MIKYLQIENFKSLKKVGIPLKRLNLFFGMNGMGKSSVIQSLLLLRQSYWMNGKKKIDELFINGDLKELGAGRDILAINAEKNELRFVIGYNDEIQYDFTFLYDVKNPQEGILKKKKSKGSRYDEPLFSKDFVYIDAEHIGPQRGYGFSNWKTDGINKYGNRGEYVVPFLALFGDKIISSKELCLESAKSKLMLDQVSAWMDIISPGVRINTELNPLEQQAKMSFAYDGDELTSTPFMPVNVGFGVPYVLPVVVSLLCSQKESLILLENPESHLHPKGQSHIADLIAKSANSGTQIICESHSDHIINGVRVAVKNGVIRNEDVGIFYFCKNKNQETYVESLNIDENGNLDKYPEGLLDEWGNLMAQLI